ncbi:MAG: tRNA pseudouridine(55) synthase TruB [Clostridiales bacterium]|nr:tRNA pseudouridine(55) synthase TruB [Clostridiales bacterium]
MLKDGVINFYKPPGMTSAQAVAFVKRLTGKKTGHAGTLDPEAAGVLPILIGKGTRINDYLMNQPKVYLAEVAFGASTDTQDAQGKVVETGTNYPNLDEVINALNQFVGEFMQLPPQYSALKIDGKTAYQLAREGKTAALSKRAVIFNEIKVIAVTPRHGFLLRIDCGKGTYIRTLCHDLGEYLGCPAHMRFLLREESSGLVLADSATMEDLQRWAQAGFTKDFGSFFSVEEALKDMPRLQVSDEALFSAINGVPVSAKDIENAERIQEKTGVCLFHRDKIIGIYVREPEVFKVCVMFYQKSDPDLN